VPKRESRLFSSLKHEAEALLEENKHTQIKKKNKQRRGKPDSSSSIFLSLANVLSGDGDDGGRKSSFSD
jgi:hypothetical protein